MLSVSETISDVKYKLENIYSFYGYASDDELTIALESLSDDVMRLYFYPRIGKTEYDRIAALDHTDLTDYEENLYWAEVYTICYEFLKWRNAVIGQLQTGSDESLTVEGYSYRTSASSSSSLNDKSYKFYQGKMFSFWSLAGYNINALERTCTIFGSSSTYFSGANIIE